MKKTAAKGLKRPGRSGYYKHMNPDPPEDQPTVIRTEKRPTFLLIPIIIVIFAALGFFLWQQQTKTKTQPLLLNTAPSASTAASPQDATAVIKPARASLNISLEVESTAGGKIKGTLTLENTSDRALPELYYGLYLRTPESVVPVEREGKVVASIIPGRLIAFLQSKNFILGSKEKKSLLIELPFSSNINPGNHTMQVAIVTKNGQSLGGTFKKLSLSGREIFLEPVANSCKVTTSGKEYPPNIGVAIDPGQAPLANCKFTNPSSKTIKARYAMDYAVRYVMGYPASEKNYLAGNDTISFAPHETKTVSIPLPSLSAPQVYEAYGRFVDEQSEPVSATSVFRWIVKGPSANIQTATLDKDFYRKGETAVVSALISPSMDLYWRTATASGTAGNGTDLTGAKLMASLSDGEGNLCGTAEKDLPTATSFNSWDAENIPVKINRDCQNPQVEVKILEAGQTLAQLSQQTQTNPASLPEATDTQTGIPFIQLLIILLGVGSSVILILFILKRNNKGTPPIVPVVIILSLAGLALGSYSLVLAQCTDPAACTIFTVTPPAANTSPQNVLWVRTGANQSGTNEQAVFGDWWLSGSYIRQISPDSIEVHFEGYTWNQNCGNFLTGFLLSNLINGDSAGLSISGVTTNQVVINQNAPLSSEPSNGPVSRTYVVTKAGGLPGSYTFTVNTEFFQIHTSADFSTPYTYYYSSNRGYDDGRDASIPDGPFSWINGELSRAGNIVDGRIYCGGGTKSGCMGRVEVTNFLTASCTLPGNNVALSWNFGTPGVYNSYNLRVDKNPVSWNGSCNPPNAGDICTDGLTSAASSFTGQTNSSYAWWLSANGPYGTTLPNTSITGPAFSCSTTTPPPTSPPPAPGAPTITSLQINNNSDTTFTSASKVSGKQNTPAEAGLGWYNPMTITLDANGSDGLANSTVKEYYVAFYYNSLPAGTTRDNFLSRVQSQLDTDPKNGFLLQYVKATNQHKVWEANRSGGRWTPITALTPFNDNSLIHILDITPNGERSWKVAISKEFGSKTLLTGAYVVDNNNEKSFELNMTPTTP